MAVPPESELARLSAGACVDAPPRGHIRFEVDADAPARAGDVLARTREVLELVVRAAAGGPWPDDDAWATILPGWFVQACGPELSAAEARAWNDRVNALPPDARDAERARRPWSVGDFVYWFEPPQRQWWWWGSEQPDADRLRVCLAAEEPSFPHEALDWLLRAAGATTVVDENVRDLTR